MTTSTMPFNDTIDAAEERLRQGFESWLGEIAASPELHARFANTLSLLEHLGSVRIARTQSGPEITEEIVQHLAEETRHAMHLKRMVRKLAALPEDNYRDESLLAGPAARGYFARLDASCRRFVRDSLPPSLHRAAIYQLVTWLVERRAMWLYPTYQRVLQQTTPHLSVRSIIGEETRHLEEIVEGMRCIGIADHAGLPELCGTEHALFVRLAGAMRDEAAHRTTGGSDEETDRLH